MPTNVKQFKAVLKSESARVTREEFSRWFRALVLTAFARIQARTPVDTGRARAGWYIIGPQGGAQRGFDLRLTNPYVLVYIANNVNYIIYLEEGSSSQAPQGMVRLTFRELAEFGVAA